MVYTLRHGIIISYVAVVQLHEVVSVVGGHHAPRSLTAATRLGIAVPPPLVVVVVPEMAILMEVAGLGIKVWHLLVSSQSRLTSSSTSAHAHPAPRRYRAIPA